MEDSLIIDNLRKFEYYITDSNIGSKENISFMSNNFDNGHIFYGLLEYLSKVFVEREKYIYYYSISQKLLRLCRGKERNLADFYVNKIYEHYKVNSNINELEFHSISSIFNPVLGYYYYYTINDYISAEKCMLELLKSIDILIDYGFKDGMYMKIEQYLNISRVYFNAGNYDKYKLYARNVIKYLLSYNKEYFEFPFSDVLVSENQLKSILEQFFNGIIFKTLFKSEITKSVKNAFFLSIFGNMNITFNKLISRETKIAFEIFLFIINGNEEVGIEMAIKAPIFNDKVPISLQYFILFTILSFRNTLNKLPETIRLSIEIYLNKVLKIPIQEINILLPVYKLM